MVIEEIDNQKVIGGRGRGQGDGGRLCFDWGGERTNMSLEKTGRSRSNEHESAVITKGEANKKHKEREGGYWGARANRREKRKRAKDT